MNIFQWVMAKVFGRQYVLLVMNNEFHVTMAYRIGSERWYTMGIWPVKSTQVELMSNGYVRGWEPVKEWSPVTEKMKDVY